MKLLDKTLIKFFGVGIINTVIGTAVMFLSYNIFHLSYWISSSLNYIVGSIVSYYLNKNFTFNYKGGDWTILWRFIINIIICYLIAYGLAKPLVASFLSDKSVQFKDNIAMLTGVFLFTAINYFGQKYIVFKK